MDTEMHVNVIVIQLWLRMNAMELGNDKMYFDTYLEYGKYISMNTYEERWRWS